MSKLFNTKTKAKNIGLAALGGVFFLVLNMVSTGVMAAKTSQYVVVAQNRISPGITLTAGDFSLQTIKGEPPVDSYTKIPDLINQQLLVNAVKGEPVTHAMVSDPKKGPTTINNLPKGFVALWVSSAIGTTGYLTVGDTVDLYDNKGSVLENGRTFQVIGAVDNQGNLMKAGSGAGPTSAVELAIPGSMATTLIQNIANLRLVLNPWGNVITPENGGTANDQTNMGYPSGIPNNPLVSSGNPSISQDSNSPKR